MKKAIVLLASATAITLGLASCGTKKTGVTKNNIAYEFYKGSPKSTLSEEGDIVTFEYILKIGDSLIVDSKKMNNDEPISISLMEVDSANPLSAGMPFEGLYMMNEGDSASFKVSPKQFYEMTGDAALPWIKETDTFNWVVKMVKFQSLKDFTSKNEKLRKVNSEFQEVAGGLKYKFISLGTGGAPLQPGDVANFQVEYLIGDSIMFNSLTANGGNPIPQQATIARKDGELTQGLFLMQEGDSTVFEMSMADYETLTGMPKQPWMKDDAKHVWKIKMTSIQSAAKIKEEAKNQETAQKENAAKQGSVDEAQIEAYLKTKNITNFKKTASGLYYVIHKEGTGATPKAGQQVTVNYTGALLDGTKFDSNVEKEFGHVEPFTVPVGQKQVIAGWDEGLLLLNKGAKATFYIPSSLGYGANGAGDKIPGNAVLIFDVEILDFK